MAKLKGITPEKVVKRLKLFLFGPAAVGKTVAALMFPNAYIIDTEKGTEEYSETIAKSKSVVFQSTDAKEIKEQLEALLTEDHNFRTLIIDPMTAVYLSIQETWNERFEKEARKKGGKNAEMEDFGMRFWGKVKAEYKRLQRLILKLDMNVIITAHQKDQYGNNMTKIGITFDSMKGDDYFFDYVFRLEKRGKERFAINLKERSEPGVTKFPEEFLWTYENFLKYYGSEIIQKKSEPLKRASVDQVNQIKNMVSVLKIDEDEIAKWLKKADSETWADMAEAEIEKCIKFCNKKIEPLKKEGK